MATLDREANQRMGYKIACMNGINPNETLQDGFTIDWRTRTISAEQIYHDHNGQPVRISPEELFTVTIELPIIALPHELKAIR